MSAYENHKFINVILNILYIDYVKYFDLITHGRPAPN